MLAIEENLDQKVGEFMDRKVVMIDASSFAAEAAKVMKLHNATSLLVSRGKLKNPVGIITERDILYKIVADGKGPYKVTVEQIMSSPLVTVDTDSTIREALQKMKDNFVRRLPVVSDDNVVGMLNLQAIVGESRAHLAEFLRAKCPYCNSAFADKYYLSKHIEQLHPANVLDRNNLS